MAFEWLLGVAVGAAWVAAVGGAYLAFEYGYAFGLASAICAAVLGLMPGFVIVVILEGARKLFEIRNETKKQTALLETIAKQLQDRAP
ncbi:MAG: hypothetical protein LBC09_06020 [Helicobacteraceae bacterium]|jgi:hypothetical protein|nr:hypothetical protein [Helicobacteraceae bacterium]